jgi:hypothetical protein
VFNPRLLATALLLTSFAQAQDGPSHVILTYKVYPDKRAAFRSSLNTRINRFTHWRDDGAINSFQILESSLADDEGWELSAIVQFGARGFELVKRFDQPDSAEIASTTTVPVDLIEKGTSADEITTAGAYLIIPYEILTSSDEYRMYARSNAVPELTAAIKEGGLLGYQLFLARFPGGRPWNAMLVLHYRDWIALGQREAVIAKIQNNLMNSDASWASWNGRKRLIVRDKVAVIAESIAAK